MYRVLAAGLLITSSLWLTGCCCSRGCGPDMGCGRSYWGAYADDPPGCDPCDTCGNWVGRRCGCARSCGNGVSFPWERARRKGGGLFSCLADRSGCCEPTCEPTCETNWEPSCEPTCEVTCGEVGCGSVRGGTWTTPREQAIDSAVAPPWRSRPMRQVSVSSFGGGPKPACNCNQ